jgi:hypothetical protein
MRFSPGLAGSRETAAILGHSRHSRAVSTVLDASRSFSVSSRGLVCITVPTSMPRATAVKYRLPPRKTIQHSKHLRTMVPPVHGQSSGIECLVLAGRPFLHLAIRRGLRDENQPLAEGGPINGRRWQQEGHHHPMLWLRSQCRRRDVNQLLAGGGAING